MELILIIVLFILAILYGLELLKNIKLEKERDIETFEKNKLERKVKKLESDEHRSYLIQKIQSKNKQISLLNSKVQYKDKIINKLKEMEKFETSLEMYKYIFRKNETAVNRVGKTIELSNGEKIFCNFKEYEGEIKV